MQRLLLFTFFNDCCSVIPSYTVLLQKIKCTTNCLQLFLFPPLWQLFFYTTVVNTQLDDNSQRKLRLCRNGGIMPLLVSLWVNSTPEYIEELASVVSWQCMLDTAMVCPRSSWTNVWLYYYFFWKGGTDAFTTYIELIKAGVKIY